jgi:DNA-binding transcriptional LysR family regulator
MRTQSHASAMGDLQDIALFVRVVEGRSFSVAARAIGATTSAVSKRIARLEGRLGARLLERTTRKVAPTAAGTAFYTRAARILADVDEAEHAIASLGGAPRGTIRVSAPVIFGERHLAPILPTFLDRYRDVRVDLALSDRFVDLVDEHFDVALRIGPLGEASLVRVRVGSTASIVVASPAYLARAGRLEVPADLANHNCLRYTLVTAAREWRFRGSRGEISVPVVGNLEVNHGGAMREAAVAGLGVARLPHFLAADGLASGALVALLSEFRLPPVGVHLVYPRGAAPLPKVKAFVETVGGALRERLRVLNRACPADERE